MSHHEKTSNDGEGKDTLSNYCWYFRVKYSIFKSPMKVILKMGKILLACFRSLKFINQIYKLIQYLVFKKICLEPN